MAVDLVEGDEPSSDPSSDGFELLDEELCYSGYAFDVFSTQWRGPGGERFQRDLVRHIGAVAVVALVDPDHVLLVRQFRTSLGASLLELPAGLRDVEGEPDATTAARELAEETGFEAGELEHLVTLATAVGFTDESISIYLATDLRETERHADGVEEQTMTVETVALDDAAAMIADGRIVDAKTVAGLLLLLRRTGR